MISSPLQHWSRVIRRHCVTDEGRVEVKWVDPDDLNQVMGSESGIKRITVTVKRNSLKCGEIVAIRSQGWPDSLLD